MQLPWFEAGGGGAFGFSIEFLMLYCCCSDSKNPSLIICSAIEV